MEYIRGNNYYNNMNRKILRNDVGINELIIYGLMYLRNAEIYGQCVIEVEANVYYIIWNSSHIYD